MNRQKLPSKPKLRSNFLQLTIAGIFAIAGIVWLTTSSAATYAASTEAENGQKSGNISVGDANGASTNASVKFGTAASGGSIIFEDDFNGPAGSLPDQSKWGDYSGCINPVAWWGSIRCGADEKLDGSGKLVLPAEPSYGTGLQTLGKFSFLYGTVSAWIKVPREAGYWPAFWLVNPDDSQGTSGEVDIIEQYTTWPTNYHDTVHSWKGAHLWSGPDDNNDTKIDLTAAYHKYSARIEPYKISFFFDDKPIGTTITPSYATNGIWPFGPDSKAEHVIILDHAVGGAGGQQTPASQPAQMLVDRVEVRSL